MTSARLAGFAAYVTASRFTMLMSGRSRRAMRTKFEPMNPRPPVTSQTSALIARDVLVIELAAGHVKSDLLRRGVHVNDVVS